MLREGEKIGPYILVRQLGRGGFGIVWLAEKRTTITTTEFALKLILDAEPDLEAIRQEAGLWKQAGGHPNVLSIIEADIYEDMVVIVSEYASDGDLNGWLKRSGGAAPSIDAAVEMMSGILAGLDHLHTRRIIHRDLKPPNILLQGNTPRLADFGIARVLKTTGYSATVAGTPPYMAPEAFDGKRSERTDLWSAGVIFYQLLTGHLPFPQTDMMTLMAAIMTREPDPLPALVPQMLQDIINCALQKDPNQRFRSAAEMLSVLRSSYSKEAVKTVSRPIPVSFSEQVTEIGNPKTAAIIHIESPDSLPPAHPDTQVTSRGSYLSDKAIKHRSFDFYRLITASIIVALISVAVFIIWFFIKKAPSYPESANVSGTVSQNSQEAGASNLTPTTGDPTVTAQNLNSNASAVEQLPEKVSASLKLTDPSGAVIPGAKVILSVGGARFEKVTNDNGYARFNQVPCGRIIRMESSYHGFMKLIVNDYLECKNQPVYLGTHEMQVGEGEVTVQGSNLRKMPRKRK
ncbi:MAG: protein kinase [Acidobacteriota bacterium]